MIITNRINTHFTNLIGDENFANAYFLNKSTGRTYEVINGKYYALSHTPRVVTDKLRQNRQQVVGEKSLIIR